MLWSMSGGIPGLHSLDPVAPFPTLSYNNQKSLQTLQNISLVELKEAKVTPVKNHQAQKRGTENPPGYRCVKDSTRPVPGWPWMLAESHGLWGVEIRDSEHPEPAKPTLTNSPALRPGVWDVSRVAVTDLCAGRAWNCQPLSDRHPFLPSPCLPCS